MHLCCSKVLRYSQGPTRQIVCESIPALPEQLDEVVASKLLPKGFSLRWNKSRRLGQIAKGGSARSPHRGAASWNVAKIYKISGQFGQLIGKGVPMTINEPAYTYTKLAEKRFDMLAKATKDTRTIEKDITAVKAVTFRVEGTW